MTVIIKCPHCRRKLGLDGALRGNKVRMRCSCCGGLIKGRIPENSGVEVPDHLPGEQPVPQKQSASAEAEEALLSILEEAAQFEEAIGAAQRETTPRLSGSSAPVLEVSSDEADDVVLLTQSDHVEACFADLPAPPPPMLASLPVEEEIGPCGTEHRDPDTCARGAAGGPDRRLQERLRLELRQTEEEIRGLRMSMRFLGKQGRATGKQMSSITPSEQASGGRGIGGTVLLNIVANAIALPLGWFVIFRTPSPQLTFSERDRARKTALSSEVSSVRKGVAGLSREMAELRHRRFVLRRLTSRRGKLARLILFWGVQLILSCLLLSVALVGMVAGFLYSPAGVSALVSLGIVMLWFWRRCLHPVDSALKQYPVWSQAEGAPTGSPVYAAYWLFVLCLSFLPGCIAVVRAYNFLHERVR